MAIETDHIKKVGQTSKGKLVGAYSILFKWRHMKKYKAQSCSNHTNPQNCEFNCLNSLRMVVRKDEERWTFL